LVNEVEAIESAESATSPGAALKGLGETADRPENP
jgi:hypothetical protein